MSAASAAMGFTQARKQALKAEYCVSTRSGFALNQGEKAEKKAYIKASEALLSQEVQKNMITVAEIDQVDLFFDFDRAAAFYEHPNTGEKVVIDLLVLEEGAVKTAVDTYVKEAGHQSKFGRKKFEAHNKGNVKSDDVPLERSTAQLRALPNAFSEIAGGLIPSLMQGQSQIFCETLAQRTLSAEAVIDELKKQTDTQLKKKTTDYQQLVATPGANVRAMADLQTEVMDLQKKKSRLNKLDLNALMRAFSAYPTDGSTPLSLDEDTIKPILEAKYFELDSAYRQALQDGKDKAKIKQLENKAEQLKALIDHYQSADVYSLVKTLEPYAMDDPKLKELAPIRKLVSDLATDLHKNNSNWQKLKSKVLAKLELSHENRAYVNDLVGMLYLTRWDYEGYCEHNQVKMKQESGVDPIFAAVLGYVANPRGYDFAGLQQSELGKGLDLSGLGALVRHQVAPTRYAGVDLADPEKIKERFEHQRGLLTAPASAAAAAASAASTSSASSSSSSSDSDSDSSLSVSSSSASSGARVIELPTEDDGDDGAPNRISRLGALSS